MKKIIGLFAILLALSMVVFTGCKGDEPVAEHNRWFESTVIYKNATVYVNFYYQDGEEYTGANISPDAKAKMKKGLNIVLTGTTGNTVLDTLGARNVYHIQNVGEKSTVWTGIYLYNIKEFLNGGTTATPYILRPNQGNSVDDVKQLFTSWTSLGENFTWKDIVKSLANNLL